MITFILAALAVIVYGIFDYFGYNKIKPVWVYRIVQFGFNLVIWTILYHIPMGGFLATLLFIFMHATFCSDFVYYYLYDHLKWYGGSYAGKAYEREVLGDKVVWAWWTPYGIFTRLLPGKKDVPIKGHTLLIQAAVGIGFSLLLSLL